MFKFKKSLVLLLNFLLLVKGQTSDLSATAANNFQVTKSTADPLDYVNSADIADLKEPTHKDLPLNLIELENNLNSINKINSGIDPLDPLGDGIENVPQDFLFSWQARRSLRKILAQMPCGWPEYNIPPMAPFNNENLTFQIENQFLKSNTTLKPFRIDGLNNMEIIRLTIGVVFQRISFDFNFPNITFSGNFDTNTTMNLQQLLGVRLSTMANGILHIGLENLRIAGSFKYKLPISFGTAKIYKLQTHVSLGNARSESSGFINGIPIDEKMNDLVVTNLLKYLNDYDFIWNGLIEHRVLPLINSQLQGKTLWKILLWSLSRNMDTCTPGALTNIDMEELHQLLLKKTPKSVQ